MLLRHQNLPLLSRPTTTPRFVGPAKAEWKVGRARAQYFIERAIQQAPSGKPVVVVAESVNAICSREIRLRRPNLWHPQVAEPEIGRKLRLIVAPKERTRFRYVGPLGKASTPPRIVLGYRVKLRKVERDRAWFSGGLHVRRVPRHALRHAAFVTTGDRVRQFRRAR